jgi:hypothetical protein|tara:strand:+ start:283 stop:468 length:186 start_codon:yes stop_codon:yes gene_type:complete
MEKLIERVRAMSTQSIKMAVKMMGGEHLPTEETMVRAALIEVFIEREGYEAGESLMEQVGM